MCPEWIHDLLARPEEKHPPNWIWTRGRMVYGRLDKGNASTTAMNASTSITGVRGFKGSDPLNGPSI
jgi:hypothetical protein